MHYKSKSSPARFLLIALVCVGAVGFFWLNIQPKTIVIDTVPVIKPTPNHANISLLTPDETPGTPALRTEAIIIRAGDTLAKRLQKLGISSGVIHALQNTDQAKPHLTKIHPGQIFTLSFSEKDELVRVEQKIDELKQLIIEKQEDASYTARLEEKTIDTYIKFASATIHDSLFLAGNKSGLSDNVIMQLADIFAYDIDFSLDIQPGDRFAILYEDRYSDGEKISAGNIIAAQFITSGRKYEAIRFQDKSGRSEYFTPDGGSMRKAFLRSPVNFTRISSRFSLARKHPVLHTLRSHKGVDYAAQTGTPIKAAGDGKVIFKGVKGGYGNVVILQHGQQYTTLYAHMSRFSNKIKNGSKVEQGDIIGYVGMSGLATGPHLHYEFRINNVHKDPLTVALPNSTPIAPQYKAEFISNAQTLLDQLDYHKQIDIASTLESSYGG